MARFGIDTRNAIGVPVPKIRSIAKKIGKHHSLAQELWQSGIHEARLLATMVGEPAKLSEKELDEWASDFSSWDVCDSACGNLFDKTPFAFRKARELSKRKREFVKRAGFALMATLAVHDKKAGDKKFEAFFVDIEREACDERNFVKKAVNWALRQIGKRNKPLNKKAIAVAKKLLRKESKSAHWVASNALKELESNAVQKRLR